ncbi:alpha/beta fold hydrolase [Streptomyces sp. NPDC058746]|uniref:alpha/beta fold hydrolase n=1 Tax=Streptomyces sp. NPDC058746 TaxID=3346622 RepID=UPI0036B7BA58
MSRSLPRLRRAADPTGGRPLRTLLLHGLGGKASVWDRFVPLAAPELELWDVELPWAAMAGSEGWGSLPDPARFLVDLIDGSGGGPDDGAGFDAVVAHSYAANLLTESYTGGRIAPRPTVLVSPFHRSSPQEFDWSVISYYLNDFHRVFEEALAVGETGRYTKAHRDWMALQLRDRIGPYGWMRFFENYLRSPFLDLGAVRAPLLVLSGSRDSAARPEDGRTLAAGVPGARFELLDDCAHFPMLERPGPFAGLVSGFLRGEAPDAPVEPPLISSLGLELS